MDMLCYEAMCLSKKYEPCLQPGVCVLLALSLLLAEGEAVLPRVDLAACCGLLLRSPWALSCGMLRGAWALGLLLAFAAGVRRLFNDFQRFSMDQERRATPRQYPGYTPAIPRPERPKSSEKLRKLFVKISDVFEPQMRTYR